MAKYLNSTGVSLLWNKIKELILDKIASIVPFVYVSTEGNLTDSQKAHNIKYYDNDYEYSPRYIIFCENGVPILTNLGRKLYRGHNSYEYIDETVYIDRSGIRKISDHGNGDLRLLNDVIISSNNMSNLLGMYIDTNIETDPINNNSHGTTEDRLHFISQPYFGYTGVSTLTSKDVFDTIYILDNMDSDDPRITSNYKIAKYGSTNGTKNDVHIVVCKYSYNDFRKLGYLQNYKVYVPNFEKSLFEVYQITETATTRIEDVPFSGIKDYTSGLMFNMPLKYLNTSVEIFTGDGSVPPTVNNNKFIINNKRLQNISATFKNLNDTTYKDILNNIYGVESINGKNCIATLKITLQDSGQGTLSYYKDSDLISVTSGTPIIICYNGGSKDELIFDNHNYEVEIVDITYYNDAITDVLSNKKIKTVEKLNETIKYINKLYIDKFSEYYNKENIDLMFSKQDTDNINKRISSNFPVKMSYDVTSSTMTFETDRQLFTIEVTGTPIVEKQYVTGYATGNLVIANGVTASVDKNGKFKREFTTNFPTFNNCKEVTHIYANGINMNKITYLRHIFKNCSNLVEVNVSDWDISNVTQADRLFDSCSKLTTIDVSNWDTSKITDIQNIFAWCSSLEHLDVSNWNVSNVTNFGVSFAGCEKLKEIDVSNWNTTKATTFFAMFESCLSLENLDFNTWTTTNVTNMSEMFYECKSLTTLDLTTFDTSKVTTMAEMFYDCNSLQTLSLGTSWYMDAVTNTSGMFDRCFNLTSVSGDIFNLKQSLNLSDCPLDNASAMVFINGISENGSGVTLMFKKSTYDTLTAAQKAIATGKGATINYI